MYINIQFIFKLNNDEINNNYMIIEFFK